MLKNQCIAQFIVSKNAKRATPYTS